MPFTFLTAEWRKLIMAQYEVAPAVLERRLPPGLELDLYQERCFVSLVGFLFDRVRILGLPVPFHTRFEEVNLRYYVRRPMPDGSSRRGVVFLSEIVPKPAITLVARMLYGEAYSTAQTWHRWNTEGPDRRAVRRGEKPLEVRYEWRQRDKNKRGLWHSMAVRAESTAEAMPAGSLAEFITEHYWGYAARCGGARGKASATTEYAVEHRRWQVYPVREHRIAANFGSLYGPDFAGLEPNRPDHVLLAEGAPVRIRWGGPICGSMPSAAQDATPTRQDATPARI